MRRLPVPLSIMRPKLTIAVLPKTVPPTVAEKFAFELRIVLASSGPRCTALNV